MKAPVGYGLPVTASEFKAGEDRDYERDFYRPETQS